MASGNSPLNVPSFPEAAQLLGQDTWRAFKDSVKLNVQVRGLGGYLNGSIPKPMSATYIYTAQSASPVNSLSPSPDIGIDRGDTAHKTWQYLIKK
ncbi:hypothetical protein BT96DRAFT_1010965 [Gymnopus androsaceus JB14]|uniref:Uncharacterized protein n=1 Tax=Gymnopus androsaceus JB14 TaxID=1447944 RepID=A0A6A4G9Y7_9AGAR|nr:hypothetical protein BT96DRAFT_1010965 [Gymnopus androsaceus JB14]